jgi:hypothetical protein
MNKTIKVNSQANEIMKDKTGKKKLIKKKVEKKPESIN